MSISFEIDVGKRIVLTRATGEMSREIMTAHQRAIAADPRFEPDFDHLMDYREAELGTLHSVDMRRLTVTNPFGAGSRRAIVVERDSAFGMARVFETLSAESDSPVRVFRSMDDAEAWLNAARPRCR